MAKSISNLATIYRDTGRYSEAEKLYNEAITIYEKTLGSDNESTLGTVKNYSELLRKMERFDEANKLEERYEKSKIK